MKQHSITLPLNRNASNMKHFFFSASFVPRFSVSDLGEGGWESNICRRESRVEIGGGGGGLGEAVWARWCRSDVVGMRLSMTAGTILSACHLTSLQTGPTCLHRISSGDIKSHSLHADRTNVSLYHVQLLGQFHGYQINI